MTQAIILAGGLGTRLRSAVPDLPKCMAAVAGKPFLQHVIAYLQQQGVKDFIFSIGYKHDVIEDFLRDKYPSLNYQLSIEAEPLGTGGAIKMACEKVSGKNTLVLNGDTLFKIDINKLLTFHQQQNASCTLALKPMYNFERYGVVDIDAAGIIQSFKEKQFYKTGLINGGVYILNAPDFLSLDLPQKFSFEKDYLEKFYTTKKITGIVQDNYFIDIGIPEDFEKAGREIGNA
ncbi:MAG: nucleotidyltransferase family protein [Ferruginibacter sp.]